MQPPPGVTAYWSHGTHTQAGVAIWARNEFLRKFSTISWEEWEPGRLGALRMEGPVGALLLINAYLDASSDTNPKLTSLRKLARRLPDSRRALSIAAGDWNFVMQAEDRFNTTTGDLSAYRNERLASFWKNTQLRRLAELQQSNYTCKNSYGYSRLDRV